MSDLYEQGFDAYNQGNYEKASLLFGKLAALEPLSARHWKAAAASLQMEKKFEEALYAWAMLSLLEIDSPLAHFHAAECLLALKKKEDGLKALALAQNNVQKDITFVDKINSLKEQYDRLRL